MRENHNEVGKTKAFLTETKKMLKATWKRAIWAVLLMMCMNFLSHGSQGKHIYYSARMGVSTNIASSFLDLYPTYLFVLVLVNVSSLANP